MPKSFNAEIIKDFAAELQGYISALVSNIDSLKKDPDQKDAREELYRLVHTIKGSAALVGISSLSHIALQMEEALDDIFAGALSFTDEIFEVMVQTVARYEAYSVGLLNGEIDERSLLEETILAFRRLRNLSTDGDKEALEPALALVSKDSKTLDADSKEDSQTEDFLLAADDVPVSELLENLDGDSGNIADGLDTILASDDLILALDEPEPADGREEILKSVETDDDKFIEFSQKELLESFFQEAEEHLQDLGRALITLESQVTDPVAMSLSHREIVRQIRRSVHTIKGAAAVMSCKEVSSWAHEVEDLLDWLFEEALEITPEIIAALAESSDLLEQIVADPNQIDSERIKALKEQFQSITGPRSDQGETEVSSFRPDASGEKSSQFEQPLNEIISIENSVKTFEEDSTFLPSLQSKTLRVDTDRVDALVNLVGELTIAFSAFDQKMDALLDSIQELDLSRTRLRESARDLEVGYEVKAIQHLGAVQNRETAAAASSALAVGEFDDFDLLELDRYSEFNLIIRSLNETVVDVGAINNQLAGFHSDFDGHLNRQRVLLSEIQDKVMRVRMTPMTIITNRLHRTVRETAAKLGKRVRMVIKGQDIELDRMVWEKLSDPLMHLLRNAVDHGIELPDQREALGKPSMGTVKVTASYQGNQVAIRINDDGAGLNFHAIRKTAQLARLSDKVNEMSEDELASLIFQPGFSTRKDVSEVSGRGVGLDVVKENINELKGTVRVSNSQDGPGTQFYLRIPLSLAVLRALLFVVDGRTYAMALNEIREILRIHPENVVSQPQKAVRIDDTLIPLYYLSDALKIQGQEAESSVALEQPLTLLVDTGEWSGAIVIDALYGQREIVIKSLGSHLRYVKGISGVTVMGDGKVVPILNVEALFSPEVIFNDAMSPETKSGTEKSLKIMVVDDSVSIREVVARTLQKQGWKTQTARDGIEALEKLSEGQPDLIVLDIEMPRMNGYEFMSSLRAQPNYRNIPVMMLTSRTAHKHREKAEALGVKGFMVKPYKDEEFIDLVRRLTRDLQN